MSNTAKPTALQTDLESATQSLESFLTPQEDKVEETAKGVKCSFRTYTIGIACYK